jgi:hypothetical protein
LWRLISQSACGSKVLDRPIPVSPLREKPGRERSPHAGSKLTSSPHKRADAPLCIPLAQDRQDPRAGEIYNPRLHKRLDTTHPDLENRFPEDADFDTNFAQPLLQPERSFGQIEEGFWSEHGKD